MYNEVDRVMRDEDEELLKEMTDRPSELHNRIRALRNQYNYTQRQIADYLKIKVSTYAHYEKGDRTPNADKLAALARLYHLDDEMLGASFPIETVLVYDKKDKERLRDAIDRCKWRKGDYQYNRWQYDILRAAAEPMFKTREEAFHFPDVDTSRVMYCRERTVMTVKMDTEGEQLIDRYLSVSHQFFDMM